MMVKISRLLTSSTKTVCRCTFEHLKRLSWYLIRFQLAIPRHLQNTDTGQAPGLCRGGGGALPGQPQAWGQERRLLCVCVPITQRNASCALQAHCESLLFIVETLVKMQWTFILRAEVIKEEDWSVPREVKEKYLLRRHERRTGV